jgi:hypothetical protein
MTDRTYSKSSATHIFRIDKPSHYGEVISSNTSPLEDFGSVASFIPATLLNPDRKHKQ